MPTSKRITLVDKGEYRVDLEYNDMYAILHLPSVSKFNKTVYLDMLNTIEDINSFISASGYSGLWLGVQSGDGVINKFVKKLGFYYIGSSSGLNVYEYEGDD